MPPYGPTIYVEPNNSCPNISALRSAATTHKARGQQLCAFVGTNNK